MIEGKCYKCGRVYYGWSLLQPRHQSCPQSGIGLLIIEDGKKIIHGYSPFTAEEYQIKLPPGAMPESEKTKDKTEKE